MNLALRKWREVFARQPVDSLDRLIRGLVPLGTVSQLSLSELFALAFDHEDAEFDRAVRDWLDARILQPIPDNMVPGRWSVLLGEFFRGIADRRLQEAGRLLRERHTDIRLWLRGLYEGSDRDPEGNYLVALAWHQADQRFSHLWRRLILGEEMPERSWRDTGILGFRKMPEADRPEAADVPDGLLRALIDLKGRTAINKGAWQQSIRSLFAAYPSSRKYWVRKFAEIVQSSSVDFENLHDWLRPILPGWPKTRRRLQLPASRVLTRSRLMPPSQRESEEWLDRFQIQPEASETDEFRQFLERHRAYTRATGDTYSLARAFKRLGLALVRRDNRRSTTAITLMEEVLAWEPYSHYSWTVYARTLKAAKRSNDALAVLWEARHRFPWEVVIRNELGLMLRRVGDFSTSEAVLCEAATHFPTNWICRTALITTFSDMGELNKAFQVCKEAVRDFPDRVEPHIRLAQILSRLDKRDEAREVLASVQRDFPNDIRGLTMVGNVFVSMNEISKAEEVFGRIRSIDPLNFQTAARLANVWFIKSAGTRDEALREKARQLLDRLASEGNQLAASYLNKFDKRWTSFVEKGGGVELQDHDVEDLSEITPIQRRIDDMTNVERLGRSMVTLWRAERTENSGERDSLCDVALQLLNVPEDETKDLLSGFVETRGLVLIVRGNARAALDYFTEQAEHLGRGGWIGIRLGALRARIALGEIPDFQTEAAVFSSSHARFIFHVAEVIVCLVHDDPSHQELALLLKELFPRAEKMALVETYDLDEEAREESHSASLAESTSDMIAGFIHTRWFRSAGIRSIDDLEDADALMRVASEIGKSQNDTLDLLTAAVPVSVA